MAINQVCCDYSSSKVDQNSYHYISCVCPFSMHYLLNEESCKTQTAESGA